jgi:hypothetical protein
MLPMGARVDARNDGQIAFLHGDEEREQMRIADSADVESFVWVVLDKLQDFMILEVGINPWPGLEEGGEFAAVGVRVDEAAVRFWYGREASPRVLFEPIPLSDIDNP